MERFHARSLLDEMAMAGSDPDLGRPPGEREALKRQEDELHRRVAGLEARAAGEKDAAKAEALAAEMAQARERLYAHYRDAQESSPVYRDLLSRTAKLPTLDEVRRWLKPGDLLLEFLAGGTGGFLVAVTPSSARIWSMHLNDDEARVMGVEPGRLSADLMRRAFLNAQGTGLVQQLADPRAAVPVAKLQVLWNTVVPDNYHKDLADGTIRRLIVIPDGPVGLFPFEALVTNDGPAPEYLLDTGPPVVYAPSAAVLLSLDARPASGPAAGREPVLALGDPAYGGEGLAAGAIDPSRAAGSARSAYARSGGRLPRLPFSGIEARWVVQQFRDNGVKAGLLTGTSATERGVRYWAPGRKVLHLACHGLADEARGNLFGALALTPGPGAAGDAADDGFLTLKEIYGLGLKGCELTVLSACQTNFGPEQLGEGTLALSRGFLVAGARRVVASNWLVDDEAAADLVSVYASHLARAEKGNQPADHAASLRDAKRWIRAQEKWKAPYYWAALVLIGPS
jgi:CHAT domain-containing protein